jgi:hypothetical protein
MSSRRWKVYAAIGAIIAIALSPSGAIPDAEQTDIIGSFGDWTLLHKKTGSVRSYQMASRSLAGNQALLSIGCVGTRYYFTIDPIGATGLSDGVEVPISLIPEGGAVQGYKGSVRGATVLIESFDDPLQATVLGITFRGGKKVAVQYGSNRSGFATAGYSETFETLASLCRFAHCANDKSPICWMTTKVPGIR